MSMQNNLINEKNEQKITELLSKMTLDEKIGQLNQLGPSPLGGFEITLEEKKQMLKAGRITKEEFDREISSAKWDDREDDVRDGKIGSFLSIRNVAKCNRMQKIAVKESRMGIPLLIGLDVVHGLKTIFPIPLAEACAFDEEIFEESAAVAARETAAMGINWTFAPMMDICRDARWGRIAEGAGEDTYLASRFAAAKVRGFQGDNLADKEKIVACAKHFVAYGAAIGGRDYNSADMSLQTLWETYLPPFKAAVDAGVATIMGAFNDLNGVPCTTNPYLYNEILRKKWGFKGMVVSDSCAVLECVAHGTAKDRAQAAQDSINAGMDMDMHSTCFIENLKQLISDGKVSESRLNDAVRNVLRIKFAAGLFDNPYTDEALSEKILLCDEHRAAALKAALGSIVLLKNNGLLPLKRNKKIAVIGELAAMSDEMLGTWAAMGQGEDAVSLLSALENSGADITYARGFTVSGELYEQEIKDAVRNADLVIAAIGEYRNSSGEAASLADISLKGRQVEALRIVKDLNKPLVSVMFNGRPMAIGAAAELCDAVLEAWHLGVEAGNAIVKVLFGEYNPSGRLSATFPNTVGECPTYYNYVPTGRPASEVRHSCKYMDSPRTPLFPFGYGLSYTEYAYSDLKITRCEDIINISVAVENTGEVTGEETVQVYVRDVVAQRVRPIRELKAFKKVSLQPKEKQTVTLKVNINDLGYYDINNNYIVESGEFIFFVGHDSTASLCEKINIE